MWQLFLKRLFVENFHKFNLFETYYITYIFFLLEKFYKHMATPLQNVSSWKTFKQF